MQPNTKTGKTRLKYRAGAFEMPESQPQTNQYFNPEMFTAPMGMAGQGFSMPFVPHQADMYASRYGYGQEVQEVTHQVKPVK